VVTRANRPTDDTPEANDPNDRRFAEVADRLAEWQAAGLPTPDRAASLPPFVPKFTPEQIGYARGLFDGAEVAIEGAAELREENRELRAHIREIWFLAHVLRHDLMEPSHPRRDMITEAQRIIDRCRLLFTRPRDTWWWVDTRGVYDAPPQTDEELASPWEEAAEEAHAAYDRLRALTAPAGPRTPGYQERKAAAGAIHKAAVAYANAQFAYGRARGRCGE
jgi:hypothetical protein